MPGGISSSVGIIAQRSADGHLWSRVATRSATGEMAPITLYPNISCKKRSLRTRHTANESLSNGAPINSDSICNAVRSFPIEPSDVSAIVNVLIVNPDTTSKPCRRKTGYSVLRKDRVSEALSGVSNSVPSVAIPSITPPSTSASPGFCLSKLRVTLRTNPSKDWMAKAPEGSGVAFGVACATVRLLDPAARSTATLPTNVRRSIFSPPSCGLSRARLYHPDQE